MRPIPKRLRQKIDQDPYYRRCVRRQDGGCSTQITIEHAIIESGSQLNEEWCLLPLCSYHHAVNEYQDGGDLKKDLNRLIAYLRASDEDFNKYPKSRPAWKQERDYLLTKYPEYAIKVQSLG